MGETLETGFLRESGVWPRQGANPTEAAQIMSRADHQHAVSRRRSWPHPASISTPRRLRMVVGIPLRSRMAWNALLRPGPEG
jgi:hypothetical protein